MILVDVNEPDEIVKLLKQSCPVAVANLNLGGMSDYWFANYEGKRLQFSRKQAAELVGDIDGAEADIAKYYNNADENYQIVEGIISPVKLQEFPITDHSLASHKASTRDLGAKLYCYKVYPGGRIEHGHSFSAINDSVLYAWEHRLAKCGVVTYYTINWAYTARLLSVIYRNEQKPPEEHNTLQRIYRPPVHLRTEKDMTKEQLEEYRFTKSLLFLSNAYQLGIGEVKAKAIAKRFCNILDLSTASVHELTSVEGVGDKMARKILSSLGRDV